MKAPFYWIVFGADPRSGDILLVSSKKNHDEGGVLHVGSYLTIEDGDRKFILRVEESSQNFPYSPSPFIVDMDLTPLAQDQVCRNIIRATRIAEIPARTDGMGSFIKPQLKARRSSQEEIDLAFGKRKGVPVFPATILGRSSQILCDNNGKLVFVNLPEDFFYHQILITGSTGSGKTVAMKLFAQYFVEELEGAVLAVNIKEEDFLAMDKPTETSNREISREWADLGWEPHGIETFRIYCPGNQPPDYSEKVDLNKCENITLKTENIDPEALSGLVRNITELGADQLPAIFRYWKEKIAPTGTMKEFVEYFSDPGKEYQYRIMNKQYQEFDLKMHPGTFRSVSNALASAAEYFDIENAIQLTEEEILQPGKMSVIDVTVKDGFTIGSIMLRDLLERIYQAKSKKKKKVPCLIIIDEVHEFYSESESRETLSTLDAICRKGRSLQIGVVFSSQTPTDLPKGIESVANTKFCFSSDRDSIKSLISLPPAFDPEGLKPGYCVAKIYGLSQLKYIKFPMALAGCFE